MTEHIHRLRWAHINPLQKDLSAQSLIHFAVFPWEKGCVLYRLAAGEQRIEDNKPRHVHFRKKADEALPSDVFLLQQEVDRIKDNPDVLFTAHPFTEQKHHRFHLPSSYLDADSVLFSQRLEREFADNEGDEVSCSHVLSEIDRLAKAFQEKRTDALLHIMEKYGRVLTRWEKILPAPLSGRYRLDLAASGKNIGSDDIKTFIIYLFGGLLSHLREDLKVLGYGLKYFSFQEENLQLSLSEKRAAITVDWAKKASNAILTKVREVGFGQAFSLTDAFQTFVQRYPHMAKTHGLGGTLTDLFTTLYSSCMIGMVKEGIVNRKWQASRIVNEYAKLIRQLPISFNDSILIGTPMETLYSLTVNTLAWLEMNKKYDHAHQISHLFLEWMESRFEHDQHVKFNKRDDNVLLAISLYKYMQKTKKEMVGNYPRTGAIATKTRVPYRSMSRVYRPRFQITEMKGFFDFVSRGYSHQVMLSSIAFSIVFILFLIFVVN